MVSVDLNADLGESFGAWQLGDDDAMLGLVTSANVACGFHAGDPSTIRRVCDVAVAAGVSIGAQVSYRDLAGFGRRAMDVPPDELADEITYQIGALSVFAVAAGDRVRYVKPHGALYHRVVNDPAQAEAVVAGIQRAADDLTVLGFPGSELLRVASAAGLSVVGEAFADRAYGADGTLVSRSEAGAVLTDQSAVVAQALRLAIAGEVVTTDGQVRAVRAGSLCLHGDTPGAPGLAARVRDELVAGGVTVASFA
jgi:5-oxoprolinase (ATP-hydrolysing) subunit A